MANANPSGPGYAVAKGAPAPEPNLAADEKAVRLPNGDVVVRRTMTNGNVQETRVFAADYPDAQPEEPVKAPKGAKSNG